jgi:hypothetical protein
MEVSRALADLEEVRSRLAAMQRFRGLSGGAAIASGVAAIGAGLWQLASAPHPVSEADGLRYVTIWSACLACSLAVNYGAILLWFAKNWSVRSRVQLKTVGMMILPSIVVGGLLTAAFVMHDELGLLPGMWCLTYALGLIASRTMAPPGIGWVAALFAGSGTALLFAQGSNALAWWVMPATFGLGQLVIGVLVMRDDHAHVHVHVPAGIAE